MRGRINVKLQSHQYDFDQTVEILKDILNRAGHPGCFSGWDFNFTQEVEYLVNAKGAVVAPAEIQGIAR